MNASARERIVTLMDAINADCPRRKKAAEELMKQLGIRESLEMELAAPERVEHLPTFHSTVSRALTPMLRARFDYAGSWKRGRDIWLGASEMASFMKQEPIRLYHRSLRENWARSAPMVFGDDRLTLFAITTGVPENPTYLVWGTDKVEPEVWTYAGMESCEFPDLERYLKWCLERE
jgi:hypothetical protein